MRYALVFLISIITLSSKGQENEKGIPFVHGKHWNEIVSMAKKENKFIFVDVFTTWCSPCKMMATQVFPQENVGNFFRKNFISVKAQMDRTKNDPKDVKMLYADFEKLESDYHIQAYPTYLFFNPDGKIVHKFIGGMSALEFLQKTVQALNPQTQFYTLSSQFDNKKTDTGYLRKMIRMAKDCYEDADLFFDAYVHTQSNMFTRENIEYIDMMTYERFKPYLLQPGLKMIIANPEKYDAIEGQGTAENLVTKIASEYYSRKAYKADTNEPNTAVIQEIENNIPNYSKRIIRFLELSHFAQTSQWTKYGDSLLKYVQAYGSKIDPAQLNDFAWNIFENCSKIELIQAAIEWSKNSLKGFNENNSTFLDTYANLLYKAGAKSLAITTEEKALKASGGGDDSIRQTLEKMKKGEKTWKD